MVPFSKIFLFLTVFPSLNNQKKLVKSSSIAVFVVGLTLFLVVCRNLMVLGADMASREVYPSFVVFKLTPLPFSVEALFDVNVALTIVIKISLCLYGACRSIAEVFGLKEYRRLIIPAAVAAAVLSCLLQKSAMEKMFVASKIVPALYLGLFVAFPLLILLISVCKPRKPANGS